MTAQNNVLSRIETIIAPYVERGEVVGVVAAVTDKDDVVAMTTAGFADLGERNPMQQDNLFWIASQTKPITATAVMMLVDDGKVNLDDPITKFLPEFEAQWLVEEQTEDRMVLKRPSKPVTLRNMLCHISGMVFRSEVEQPTLDGLAPIPKILSYANTPLKSEPGERYEYSNMGFNTAGRIIEVVTGKTYAEFLDERLFGPLGMTDTTFWPKGSQLARIAKAYKPNEEQTKLVEFQTPQLSYPLDNPARQPMPGGGLFSTAIDCAKFCQLMLNRGKFGEEQLLSEHSFSEMTRRQTPTHLEQSYGIGFSIGEDRFSHGGALSSDMSIFPKLGVATIYLIQHGGFLGNGAECRGTFQDALIDAYS